MCDKQEDLKLHIVVEHRPDSRFDLEAIMTSIFEMNARRWAAEKAGGFDYLFALRKTYWSRRPLLCRFAFHFPAVHRLAITYGRICLSCGYSWH